MAPDRNDVTLVGPAQKPRARTARIVLSTEEANRLVQGSAAATAEAAQPFEELFREEIRRLLRSGAVADGRALVGGREALRTVSRDGRTTYLVDAETMPRSSYGQAATVAA